MPPTNLLPTCPRSGEGPVFERAWLERDLVTCFEAAVSRRPAHPAVLDPAGDWSYAGLNAGANLVAQQLLGHNLDLRQAPVGILAAAGAPALAGILGVLKAGGFYVMLAPSDPDARLQQVAGKLGLAAWLAQDAQLARAHKLAGANMAVLELPLHPPQESPPDPRLAHAASNLALLVLTSGSEGLPKAVVYNHQNVLHVAWQATRQFALRWDDRIAVAMPFHFGGSVQLIYLGLLNGVTLAPFDLARLGPGRLAQYVADARLTFLHLAATPARAAWQACLELRQTTPGQDFPHLRLVGTGGETLNNHDLALWRRAFGSHTALRTGGGSTEALWVAEAFWTAESQPDDGPIPFGYPLPDKEIRIVDAQHQLLPPGERGEIAVCSPFISQGYWRDPGTTASRFDPADARGWRTYYTGDLGRMDPDGLLYHLGRLDQQIKVGGVRVEPGELENVLLQQPGVRLAAAVGYEGPLGETSLAAFVEPQPGATLSAGALRAALAQNLPAQLRPRRILILEALPLTSTGKVDRRILALLAASENARPEDLPFTPAASPGEALLARLWGEVLGMAPVGVEDPFLALGGSSLAAFEIARRAHAAGLALEPRQLFEHATIRELVLRLEGRETGEIDG